MKSKIAILSIFCLIGTLTNALSEEKSKEQAHKVEANEKQTSVGHSSQANAQSDHMPPPIAAIRKRDSNGCMVDASAVQDLKKRKEELEKYEQDLASKSKELEAKERALQEEIKKLQLVRDEITQKQDQVKKVNEEKVNKLVETFESMGPKPASAVLATLDENLAIAALSKVSTAKLAKILSAMDAIKATRLTELLAGVGQAKESKKKGGEKDASESIQLSATDESNRERVPASESKSTGSNDASGSKGGNSQKIEKSGK